MFLRVCAYKSERKAMVKNSINLFAIYNFFICKCFVLELYVIL